MATTFGLANYGQIEPTIDKDGDLREPTYTAIARRSNDGRVSFLYPFGLISHAFDGDCPVYPLNNTAQGIETIGDLKREIEETK